MSEKLKFRSVLCKIFAANAGSEVSKVGVVVGFCWFIRSTSELGYYPKAEPAKKIFLRNDVKHKDNSKVYDIVKYCNWVDGDRTVS